MPVFFKQFNWIDLLVLIVVLFYSFEGYSLGFIASTLDLLSFIISFVAGLKTYMLIASVLTHYTSIPPGLANAIGFFTVALIVEILLNVAFGILKRTYSLGKNSFVFAPAKKIDSLLGIISGAVSAFVLLTFILTVVTAFPLSPFIRNSISSSELGNLIVSNSQGFEKSLNTVFGGVSDEMINFLTVEPKDNEIIRLNFRTGNFSVDASSEQQMFKLVNQQRASNKIASLVFNDSLRDVGRAHCEDMFRRGYFSHYTPEGLSPFDRMAQANITYTYAGENLAFAQNVNLAMEGFMQSPGHRANILSPNFGKIGIGVIDGGIYGEMFCQEFTD